MKRSDVALLQGRGGGDEAMAKMEPEEVVLLALAWVALVSVFAVAVATIYGIARHNSEWRQSQAIESTQ